MLLKILTTAAVTAIVLVLYLTIGGQLLHKPSLLSEQYADQVFTVEYSKPSPFPAERPKPPILRRAVSRALPPGIPLPDASFAYFNPLTGNAASK